MYAISAHVVSGDEGFIRLIASIQVPTTETLVEDHAGVILDFVKAV